MKLHAPDDFVDAWTDYLGQYSYWIVGCLFGLFGLRMA